MHVWKAVIPCGEAIADPRPILGSDLSDALRDSGGGEKSVADTDVGHVFAGLEAMACPRAKVDVDPLWDVEMPNTEFATWGGDIGSAVAHKVLDERNGTPHPFSFYIGGPSGVAKAADLNGDIDAFALRNGLLAANCASGTEAPIVVTQRVSELLHEYFAATATPIGAERSRRYKCFVQMVGGVLNGTSIVNSTVLENRFKARIEDFAFAFLVNELTGPPHDLSLPRALLVARRHQAVLLARSEKAMGVFLAFLERHL